MALGALAFFFSSLDLNSGITGAATLPPNPYLPISSCKVASGSSRGEGRGGEETGG